MPKEKESFSERERIRRAKEGHKYMNLQERIEFLKDEKKREVKKNRHQRKEESRRITKEVRAGRY